MKMVPLDSKAPVSCPVLLMTFNRPHHTARVWETLKSAKPRQLWISQDGPRKDNPTDRSKCKEVRSIVEKVDWHCDIHRLYREENAGCGRAVSSAIEWFLGEAVEGIILEDDTVPTFTFFRFCEEMLERYRSETSIASISGSNLFPERIQNALGKREDGSSVLNVHLSKYFSTWGWATWQDRWDGYSLSPDDSLLAEYQRLIQKVGKSALENHILQSRLSAVHSGALDTWDFQFEFHSWLNQRCHLIPSGNLVSNIGFDEEATHTTREPAYGNAATVPCNSLALPDSLDLDAEMDQLNFLLREMDTPFLQPILDELKMLRNTCDERLELIETLHEAMAASRSSKRKTGRRNSPGSGVKKGKLTKFFKKFIS